jgi:hypothetical protein
MKVKIHAKAEISYLQVVEMSKEEFADFNATPDSKMSDPTESPLSSWLDVRDIHDCHEMDLYSASVID